MMEVMGHFSRPFNNSLQLQDLPYNVTSSPLIRINELDWRRNYVIIKEFWLVGGREAGLDNRKYYSQ